MTMKIEMPASWSEVRLLLLPKVRERYFFAQHDGQPRLYRCLGDDLAIGVVLDHPKRIIYVTTPMLGDWNVSPEDVFLAARENLSRRTPNKPFKLVAPGLYRSPWQDNYDATRLILTSSITALEAQGHPVAVAVSRKTVLVTGSNDPAGLTAMFQMVRQELTREELLTPIPLVLQADGWVPYYPAEAGWRDIIESHWAELYRQQSLDLEKHHADDDIKVHVALLLPVRKDEELLFTLTNWPKNAVSLLPVARWVTLGAVGDPKLRAYSWDTTLRHFGAYLSEEPGFPKRYRSNGFPGREELEAVPSTPMQELTRIGYAP